MKTNPKAELTEKFRPDLSNEFFAKRNGLVLEDELAIFYDLHASLGNERSNWQAVLRRHLINAAADHGRIPVPDWVPAKEWNDYLEMRERMRKGTTPAVQKLGVKRLAELRASGRSVVAVLQSSIANQKVVLA